MSRVLKTMTSWKTGTKIVDGGFLNDRKKWIRNQEKVRNICYKVPIILRRHLVVQSNRRLVSIGRGVDENVAYSTRFETCLYFLCVDQEVYRFRSTFSDHDISKWGWLFKADSLTWHPPFLCLLSSTRLIVRWGSCPKRNTPDHSLESHPHVMCLYGVPKVVFYCMIVGPMYKVGINKCNFISNLRWVWPSIDQLILQRTKRPAALAKAISSHLLKNENSNSSVEIFVSILSFWSWII